MPTDPPPCAPTPLPSPGANRPTDLRAPASGPPHPPAPRTASPVCDTLLRHRPRERLPMTLRIEKKFVVAAPADAVWAFLTDPRKVASCLPGASITGEIDEKTYAGAMNIKVGPVNAQYRGKLRFERLDAEAREAEIAATGQETRGTGGADMR